MEKNLDINAKNVIDQDGIQLHLSSPDEIQNMQWIGGETYMSQLLAAWIIIDSKHDIPMNPQILGKPGVGKTTLAYTAASKFLDLPVYIFQCTVDTRPEDLIISPVIGPKNTIEYHASSLVTAMIQGGVCILDEANRMSEKSWASLAPLLDQRRYVESIIAGIKIHAHTDFRICCTMNEDSSTFEIPEYIHSRLQPQIFIDFPDREEEIQILKFNLPYAKKDIIQYTVNFLQQAHRQNKDYTARDGINICRYYLKMENYLQKNKFGNKEHKPEFLLTDTEIDPFLFRDSIKHILGLDALHFLVENRKYFENENINTKFQDLFRRMSDQYFDENFEEYKEEQDFRDELFDEEDLFDEDENEENNEETTPKKFGNRNNDDFGDKIDENWKNREGFISFDPKDDVLHFVDEQDDNLSSDNHNSDRTDPNEIIRWFLQKKEIEKKSRTKKRLSKKDEKPKNPKNQKKSKNKDENSHGES